MGLLSRIKTGASTFRRNIIITLWKPYYVGCLKKSICQKRMLPLKQYQQQPRHEISLNLQDRFNEIFGRCYIRHGLLNNVLLQIRNRKIELLRVLDCPEFPLHNNAAETDIREYVTRREISGGTHSELGRKARDTFVGLKKTCRKLGISFWN